MPPEKEKQIPMIFDTHAHYDDHAFDGDREEIIASLADAGIGTVVNVAADRESVRTTLGLSEKYPFIWCALGFHPSSAGDMTEDDIRMLREALASPKAAAVGEIGLDYHWDEPGR
jgi:TatD DNase family protein